MTTFEEFVNNFLQKLSSPFNLDDLRDFLISSYQKGIRVFVFDMDKTILSKHSNGVIKEEKLLEPYLSSITPCSKILFDFLTSLPDKFDIKVAIATKSDGLYTHRNNTKKTYSGEILINLVLKEMDLSSEQIKKVAKIDLNPDLYNSRNVLGEVKCREYYKKKIEGFLGKEIKLSVNETSPMKKWVYPPKLFKKTHLDVLSELYNLPLSKMVLIDDTAENLDIPGIGMTINVTGKSGLWFTHLK